MLVGTGFCGSCILTWHPKGSLVQNVVIANVILQYVILFSYVNMASWLMSSQGTAFSVGYRFCRCLLLIFILYVYVFVHVGTRTCLLCTCRD